MNTLTLELPLILPSGQECGRCASRLQEELGRIKGVSRAEVDAPRATITVAYDPDVTGLSHIEREAKLLGAGLAARIDHQTLELRDLDCPDCAATIEKAVSQLPGIIWASANFAAGQIYAEFERDRVSVGDIARVAAGHGVRACPVRRGDRSNSPAPGITAALAEHRRLIQTLATVALALMAATWRAVPPLSMGLYAAAIALGGSSTLRAAYYAVRARAIDMNVLMTLAVIGAAGIGDLPEAATVVVLYNIGTLLQASTVERTRRSIRSLMQLAPQTATLLRDGAQVDTPVERVRPGETVVVRPGGRIPMDGEVVAGRSAINQAPITGESMPVERGPGDIVFAGTLNGLASLQLRVTRPFEDTTLARIIHRVEEAQAQRAPSQQMIDRFARTYTPAVVLLAAVVAIAPPLMGAAGGWPTWLHRALSLLIIACPCALVISTPVAIVTAIGAASRAGALIKGGAFLETLGRLKVMLYDKTGTLTQGRFRVLEVVTAEEWENGRAGERKGGKPGAIDPDSLLRLAAAVESRSEHPLRSAFLAAAPKDLPPVEAFIALPGRGASGIVEDRRVAVGNLAMMEEASIALTGASELLEQAAQAGRTPIFVAIDGQLAGLVLVADAMRQEAPAVVREMSACGIQHQAMLSGDHPAVARTMAAAAGLSDWQAGLLPDDKLTQVRAYRDRFGPVGMVGDGINDAPALATADVGIVMGAAGSDTAIETADVALMADDLTRLPYLLRLSRRTAAIVRQNIAFSLATKAALLVAALFTLLPLWLAVLGDVGVSLLVTLNALRLARA